MRTCKSWNLQGNRKKRNLIHDLWDRYGDEEITQYNKMSVKWIFPNYHKFLK